MSLSNDSNSQQQEMVQNLRMDGFRSLPLNDQPLPQPPNTPRCLLTTKLIRDHEGTPTEVEWNPLAPPQNSPATGALGEDLSFVPFIFSLDAGQAFKPTTRSGNRTEGLCLKDSVAVHRVAP
jgi:hypothetical protein